jgi:hypothetical protein
MELFVISTNMDGCLFGNYFTETLRREEAEEKLKQVRKADSNAKLLKVVIGKEDIINADKEDS